MSDKERYSGQEEEIFYKGHRIKVDWHHEECGYIPWEESDCYGSVSNWVRRDKYPGEVIIASDRGSYRFFDLAGLVAELRQGGMTGEEADKAARATCARMKAWCNDEWCYLWVSVEVPTADYDESCGMIESDYASDCLEEMLIEAKRAIDKHQANLVTYIRLLMANP
jgi:hypothetical protein